MKIYSKVRAKQDYGSVADAVNQDVKIVRLVQLES